MRTTGGSGADVVPVNILADFIGLAPYQLRARTREGVGEVTSEGPEDSTIKLSVNDDNLDTSGLGNFFSIYIKISVASSEVFGEVLAYVVLTINDDITENGHIFTIYLLLLFCLAL